MTLRARLTWILLATLVPLGLAVGCGLYVFVRGSLYARLDDALAARAETLAAAVKSHAGQIEFDFEDAAMPQYQPRPGAAPRQIAYFEIWRLNGATLDVVIERSTSLGAATLLGVPGDPMRERRSPQSTSAYPSVICSPPGVERLAGCHLSLNSPDIAHHVHEVRRAVVSSVGHVQRPQTPASVDAARASPRRRTRCAARAR